ncbi:competence type IV pilus major pilin ComGC [Siminovitchia sediminis]|uniref:ComG operon protein 3 n=1 Tax=Siminovitchia sediminis TaxID=1274353 RepID=A0ABW4KE42_9BACI
MKRLWIHNEKGFTLMEMMVVLLVITVLLLIALPNITSHSSKINDKGCEGLKQMVQSQVEAYRIDNNAIPTLNDLKTEDYLGKDRELVCPNGYELSINSTTGKVE